MNILFRREQRTGVFGKIIFHLWCKIEPDEEEQKLIDTYNLRGALLIAVLQPLLIRNSILFGLLFFFLTGYAAQIFFYNSMPTNVGIALVGALGAGYWWYNQRRETIYLKDLAHGRQFKCNSIINLIKKEAELEGIVGLVRQVLESAKHWDGTETIPIEALPKDEAKQYVLRVA